MKNLFLILFSFCYSQAASAQVGIGTTTPHSRAALEIRSTEKGVLFPRLSSAQRDAISNPPNGLHIFNTDERCLNYYDSVFQVWNCYCETEACRVATIRINAGSCVDFFNTYGASLSPGQSVVLLVEAGDTIADCGSGALNFSTLPFNLTITLINRGTIIGRSGSGGFGATGQSGSCIRPGGNGSSGGNAILMKPGITITVHNYGIIAGGGGGGGGGGSTGAGIYGGGGGGGAGYFTSNGGTGGGNTLAGPFGSCGTITSIAQNGMPGGLTSPGAGGNGANGGGNGGTGGNWALQGQNGTGSSPGLGGPAGKAVTGSIGNSILNFGPGQVFGLVD